MADDRQEKSKGWRRRRFNLRFVLIGMALLLPIGVGVHFLHAYQVRRSAQVLLQRAHQLEEAGQIKEAAKYYRQYVGLAPDDIDARISLATALDDSADSLRRRFDALQVFEGILRDDPQQDDVRRRVIQLWMSPEFQQVSATRFEDARTHIEFLLKSMPGDGDLRFRLGVCHESGADFQQAAESYEQAITDGYREPDVYVQYARLLRRRLEQPERADELMSDMVEANPDLARAFLARALYRRDFGSIEEMNEDLRRAEEIDAKDPDVVILLIQRVLDDAGASEADLEDARGKVETAISAHPNDLRLYQALSQIETKAGRAQPAIDALSRALKQAPNRAEVVWLLADLLISNNRLEEADRQLERLRELDTTSRYIDYLRGRIELAQGNPLEAARLLKPLRGERVQNPQLARMVNLQLAECYRRMGRFEEQWDAFQKIVQDEPLSTEGRLGQAAALSALGRVDEALAIYRDYLEVPAIALVAARLMIAGNLRQLPQQRDWQQVESILNQLQKFEPESVDLALLRAEMLQGTGQPVQAVEVLEQALEYETAPALISVALSRLSTLREEFDEARAILDRARQRFGDSVPLRLAQSDALEKERAEAANDIIRQLAADSEQFSDGDRRSLFEGLANALYRLEDFAGAEQMWARVAGFQPQDVQVHFRLFNLALRQQDDSAAAKALAKLRAIEGEEGSHVRAAQAIQLVERAGTRGKASLDEAQRILRRLESQRPSWFLVPLTNARIDELTGDYDSAARHYEQAIRLGHRDSQVLLRAIQLFGSRGQQAAAIRLFRRVESENPLMITAAIRRLVTEVSLQTLDFDQALSMARETVPATSANAGDHIWLSRVLSVAGQAEESEESLRKAVEVQPDEPAAWVALVLFLARTQQTQEAEAAIEQAKQSLPEKQVPLVLGLCYEQLRDIEKAEEYYLRAVELNPDNVGLSQNLAAFYLRNGRGSQAEPILRKLIEAKASDEAADARWERRVLAASIARRDYPHFQEALGLLDENLETTRSTEQDPRERKRLLAIDQRLKARLLGMMPNRELRRSSIEILEGLNQQEVLLPGDLQLLSRLYDWLNEPENADARWESLVTAQPENPAYISQHVLRLLRRGKVEQAEEWLGTLRGLTPDTFTTCELTARLHLAKKDYDQIIPTLLEFLRAEAPAQTLEERQEQVLPLLEATYGAVPAESPAAAALQSETARLYREQVKRRPESTLAFARFVARAGDLDGALDLCQQALETSPSTATAAALGMVRALGGSEEHKARVEAWLETNVEQVPDSPAALLQLADLRDLQQQFDEAMQLYRRILELNPQNIVALNNLAWLLSVRSEEHVEAEQLINTAIEHSGPVAVLLDTRGTIRFYKGDLQSAIEDFDASIAEQDIPGTRFHRAQAHWAAGDRQAATADMQKAQAEGLSAENLQPLERDAYRELLQAVLAQQPRS